MLGFLVRAFKVGQRIMEHMTDKYVMEVFELSRKVNKEADKIRGFIRFSDNGNYLLAQFEPKCDMIPVVMWHFVDRYPGENFVFDDDRIAVLPEGMSLDYGAMIEPVAVAAHATMRGGDLKGKNVVVSGAGTIGNLVAQFAKARGAKRVLITDVSDFRLEIARKCGIIDTLNVAKTPLKEGAKRLFGDEDFQAAFEVAGVESSIRSLMECIEKGSNIVVVAVFGKDPSLNMFYLGEHELKVNGTMMYRHEDYLTAIDQVSSGAIRLEPLISNHFPFEQYDEAYKFIDEHSATSMKIIIKL